MTRQRNNKKCGSVWGTGLLALDVIVQKNKSTPPTPATGGTCGNVLLALRFLGFEAVPISRLDCDVASRIVMGELRRWGVNTKYVTTTPDGSTPVIVHKIYRPAAGEPTHTFSWRCPTCGSRFPSFKPILSSTAEQIARNMRSPKVFFFDRVSRGALILANRAADCGAIVVFEPSGIGDPDLFREAWSVAHIVKYSHERLPELPDDLDDSANHVLQIETSGTEGLRYRARYKGRLRSPWRTLDAFKAPVVEDTAGSGDWCIAGLLYCLAGEGIKGLRSASPTKIESSLRFGQAIAAWNCGFVGARGGMARSTKEECLAEVTRILSGQSQLTPGGGIVRKSENRTSSWCSICHEVRPEASSAHTRSRRTTA